MPITIKHIAEHANVSIGTVSRALNNDPYIAVKTREKIQRLAKELKYVPNHFGRGLRAQKSRLIGYLIANIDDSFYNEIMQGISRALSAKGYSLVVGMTEQSIACEQRQLELFREKSVDGIIISNYGQETVSQLRAIADDGVPMVVCDFESFAPDIPHVKVDDREAMRLLTQHLYDLGRRNFCFCYEVNAHSRERFEAHKRVAGMLGCPPPLLCRQESDLTNALKSEQKPTAIICYSDYIAIKTKHLVESLGFSVPGDIAITGFDDIAFAAWPEISLTTIAQPRTDLGRIATERLFDIMDGKSGKGHVILQPELKIRKTTTG